MLKRIWKVLFGASFRYWYREEGDANFYVICKGNQWFARVQLNGEMLVDEHRSIMNNICKHLNQGE